MAYEEIRSLRRLHGDVPVYLVDVVHSRPLSRFISERLGIAHASPQVIILRAGVPAWHGSHFDLRADEMARKLERLKGPRAGGHRLALELKHQSLSELEPSFRLHTS
jgi:hypothetical protein